MEVLFDHQMGNEILVYLDVLLMFAETQEELLAAFDRILRVLIRAGLKCKPRKCQLLRESGDYLRPVISKG